jgi:hypothetical protein
MLAPSTDGLLRGVGTVKLWYDVVSGGLLATVLAVLTIMLVRYHSNWTSGHFTVESATCGTPRTIPDHGDGSTEVVRTCTATVDGFAQAFEYDDKQGAAPVTQGSQVKVFYDPNDRKSAMLGRNDFFDEHKTMLVFSLVIAALLVSVSAVVQYMLRKNALAQRVAGGAAIFDLATGTGL